MVAATGASGTAAPSTAQAGVQGTVSSVVRGSPGMPG